MDRKRQAEELPAWSAESKEAPTPWRKPRHHVYGYRQRDYAAEAEILKEQEDWQIVGDFSVRTGEHAAAV